MTHQRNAARTEISLLGEGKEQRRIRNRLSQRTTRERKAAYVRDLEQRLELYETGKESSRIQELLSENARLRNGLHLARRRLFSISTSLNCAADSLKPLLDLKGSAPPSQKCPSRASSPPMPLSESPPNGDIAAEDKRADGAEGPSSVKSNNWSASLEAECPSTDHAAFAAIRGDDDTINIEMSPHVNGSSASGLASHAFPDALLEGRSFETYDDATTLVRQAFHHAADSVEAVQLDMMRPQAPASDSDRPMSRGMRLGTGGLQSTSYAPAMFTAPVKDPNVESSLSAHLDCLINILRRGGITTQYTHAPQIVDDMLDGFIEECWPCMKTWYTMTDSYTTIRWVLWWQISQTSEALEDIPVTNTPTPVQRALSHPSIIDWIPFASVRNRLIISDGYEIDRVFCDLTEAFVLQKEEGTQPVHPTGGAVMYKSVVGLLRAALRSADPSESQSGDIFDEGPLKRTKAASSAYCQQLINFGRWVVKLDPSFFSKYPALYDPAIVSSGPCWDIIGESQIQRPKPLNTEAINTYASILLKDQNYRTYGMDSRLQHSSWTSPNDTWRDV